jgi:hypothetical protein
LLGPLPENAKTAHPSIEGMACGAYSDRACGGLGQLSGLCVMPVFFGVGIPCPFSGFCQLSGTKVMPDLFVVGAVFPEIPGTTMGPRHMGHGISLPEYCSSYSRDAAQCGQLNFIWFIKLPFRMEYMIYAAAESVQPFLLYWDSISANSKQPNACQSTPSELLLRVSVKFL